MVRLQAIVTLASGILLVACSGTKEAVDTGTSGGDVAESPADVTVQDLPAGSEAAALDAGPVDVPPAEVSQDTVADTIADIRPETVDEVLAVPEDSVEVAQQPPFPCCAPGADQTCAMNEEGDICVGLDGMKYGKCKTPLPAPFCWSDDECNGGEICKGASICPCDADCDGDDIPGKCLPEDVALGCCLDEEDCDNGTDAAFSCAFAPGETVGVCLMLPGTGKCWDYSDCDVGQICKGASFCPCPNMCGMMEMAGDCVADAGADVGELCSNGNDDCKKDLVCCYPCGIEGCDWQCDYPCDDNEVWCAGGCPMYP